jgi:hypothetical protein
MVRRAPKFFEDKLSFPGTFLIFAFPAVVSPASVKIGGLDPFSVSVSLAVSIDNYLSS